MNMMNDVADDDRVEIRYMVEQERHNYSERELRDEELRREVAERLVNVYITDEEHLQGDWIDRNRKALYEEANGYIDRFPNRLDRWDEMKLSEIFDELNLYFRNLAPVDGEKMDRHQFDIDTILTGREQYYIKKRIEEYYPESCCWKKDFRNLYPYENCGTCQLATSLYAFLCYKDEAKD